MTKNPLVSVYITNYNYGKFIKQSIESVLEQSFQDFELLIIDDGSTDNSKSIIESYSENDKIAIIYQKNKGLNITNNVAMRAANGKYIVRLDADDFLEKEALKEMSEVLEANNELGLIFPDYYYVDTEGNRIGEEKRHNFDKEVSLYDSPAHGACTMIRLSFLKNLGGYNESFTCQDGYDLWIKFITHHKVTNVTKPLFSYRQHGNNLTTNEERILSTRKKIKELYVQENLAIHKTLAVIPVRSSFIDGVNWPLFLVNGKSILEKKIDECLKSKNIKQVIISTSDEEILDYSNKVFAGNDSVSVLERPKKFSGPNETLGRTIEQSIQFANKNLFKVEAVMSLSLEYPYLTADTIDDAINTLALFKADSVLSVRPDNRMYYQHSGHSLLPILDQDNFTKQEREAIYKGAGGIALSTAKNFRKNKRIVSGSISHIVVDQKTAFGVFGKFDFMSYSAIEENNNH